MANPLIYLYIDTSKSPRAALVQSLSVNTPTQINPLVADDNVNFCLVFCQNNVIDTTISGDATYHLTGSIGDYSTGVLVQSNNWYTSASYGFTGSMNLATAALTSSLVNLDSITTLFQIIARDATGNRRTYLQAPITVYNQILS